MCITVEYRTITITTKIVKMKIVILIFALVLFTGCRDNIGPEPVDFVGEYDMIVWNGYNMPARDSQTGLFIPTGEMTVEADGTFLVQYISNNLGYPLTVHTTPWSEWTASSDTLFITSVDEQEVYAELTVINGQYHYRNNADDHFIFIKR